MPCRGEITILSPVLSVSWLVAASAWSILFYLVSRAVFSPGQGQAWDHGMNSYNASWWSESYELRATIPYQWPVSYASSLASLSLSLSTSLGLSQSVNALRSV